MQDRAQAATDEPDKQPLTNELKQMQRLHELVSQLLVTPDLHRALAEILDAAIEITRAQKGNVQLVDDRQRVLQMAAQRGFDDEFLDFFREVSVDDPSACGRATANGRRVVIEDVEEDPQYEPLRGIASNAGYRSVQSTPLVNRDGELLGMLSTHYRQPHRPAELELRMLDLLARQAADLIERQQVEQALLDSERRGREAAEAFLAVMSHELRTPVTTIHGNAALLVRDPQRGDAADLLTDVRDEADRLIRIIDDLLVISRVDRGLLNLTQEPVLLQHAVSEVVADVARRFPAAKIDVDVPRGLPPVVADTTAFGQALYNLLINAAKYAGSDGPITVEAREREATVDVAVLDEGPGLSSDPEALFELFHRGPQASQTSGTGVGLYVVRALLSAMGATVEASSRGDGGAAFSFALPVAVDEER